METIQTLLLVLQVIVAITLISFILIQHGKGADAGAAFGSGASSTVFGSRGSGGFLAKATTFLAIVFLTNSLVLGYIAANATSNAPASLLEDEPVVLDRLPADESAEGSVDTSSDVPVIPDEIAKDIEGSKLEEDSAAAPAEEVIQEQTTESPVSDIPAIPNQ